MDQNTDNWRKSTHSGGNGGDCVEVGTAVWRKSTYSSANGGQCVEVGTAVWRKSTYSGGNGGQCVEVGSAATRIVVRDTTNRAGAMLAFAPDEWRALLAKVRAS